MVAASEAARMGMIRLERCCQFDKRVKLEHWLH